MITSIDGEIVPPERATVSVLDRGLLYGDGVFEVLRTWGGKPALLDAHLDRLYAGAAHIKLRAVERAQLASWVRAAIPDANDHRIRIVLTRGPGPLSARLAELSGGRAIVIVEPLPPQPHEIAIALVDWPLPRRRTGIKALAYLDHVIARELAAEAGADEAVRLDERGDVAECATSNVFAVTAGAIATPPLDRGILPGIVRSRVIALCARLGIACVERPIAVHELHSAHEVFLTSSLRGVVSVTRIDGAPRTAGPITARVMGAYVDELMKLLY